MKFAASCGQNVLASMSGTDMFEPLTLCIKDLVDIPENDYWLGDGEREVLAGLRFTKRRNDWRLGRWTAKLAALAFLHIKNESDLSLFEIRAASDGAPEVFIRNKPAEVAISISHAGRRSFCVAGPPCMAPGCDIELLEPRGELLAMDYFTHEEIEFVRTAAPEHKVLVTNFIWSAKESVLKALREGLRRDTRSICIQPGLTRIFHCQEIVGLEEHKNVWSRWTGICRQTSREFHGHWRADSRFVYTFCL